MNPRRCLLVIILNIYAVCTLDENKIAGSGEKFEGLYTKDDKVHVLNVNNFKDSIYDKQHAWIVEFYNSWCGFCQRFAPEWKQFASDVSIWGHVARVGAIDCADDANNEICRDFEIMAYPTIRFFHEKYAEKSGNIGEKLNKGSDAVELRDILVSKLQQEQEIGRGLSWPSLNLNDFQSFADVWFRIPKDIKVTFLIFENLNSTVGSEVILDMDNVFGIRILRVSTTSQITKLAKVTRFPNLLVLKRDLSFTRLTPKEASRETLRKAVLIYLQSNKFTILQSVLELIGEDSSISDTAKHLPNISKLTSADVVYQADLETTLRYTLHHEITNHKSISGERLEALKKYIRVLEKYFPFTANGKPFITDLIKILDQNDSWEGIKLTGVIEKLESNHSPVYSTLKEWIGCKGSAPQLRGFTCGLWTMFHTLAVNAAIENRLEYSNEGKVILESIHGYVRYFFGCADCSEHFQAMAQHSKMFDVHTPEKAVLWLWLAHNEVNLRLAGDSTDDPMFPKKQFPPADVCSTCRLQNGNWNINTTYDFLLNMYGVRQINLLGAIPHVPLTRSLASLDVRYLGLLYMLSVIILLLIVKLFLTKRLYRKKKYLHDNLGKV